MGEDAGAGVITTRTGGLNTIKDTSLPTRAMADTAAGNRNRTITAATADPEGEPRLLRRLTAATTVMEAMEVAVEVEVTTPHHHHLNNKALREDTGDMEDMEAEVVMVVMVGLRPDRIWVDRT